MTQNNMFVKVSVSVLRKVEKALIFDIYVERSEGKFTKIFNINDEIDLERLKSYEMKGITNFYVTEDGYQRYVIYVDKLGSKLAEDFSLFSKKEVVEVIKEMTHYTMQELVTKNNISAHLVASSENVVFSCIKALESDPKYLGRIMKSLSTSKYLFKHSMNVAIFSLLLGKQVDIKSDRSLQILGLGAFLHDIGMGQLSFDPEDKVELTMDEMKEIKTHTSKGKESLDVVKGLKDEISIIVLQHHERPNGLGYPNHLKGGDIFYLAKIVAIADSFAAMISKRSYRKAFRPEEAIMKMKLDRGKFDHQLLNAFAKIFLI